MTMSPQKKSRMGRPPVDARKRRSRFVTVRFTDAEHRQLTRDAKATGRTVAEYLRDCWQKGRA
jgi:hypothetical protein